jgi:hypothetical protein
MSSSPDPPQPEAGVVISGTVGSVSGDIVGRDKITHGLSAEQLVAVLEARGLIQPAEAAGLQDDPLLRWPVVSNAMPTGTTWFFR